MATDDNIIVLNDYGLTERSRTTASGAVKKRYTVQFKAEPIVHNLDPVALGAGPADAIAEFLRQRIGAITAQAAPATLRARAAAAKAVAAGKSWATRRYAGGRIGSMPPGQSDALFNDSGRLVQSIVARATKTGLYVVNVAANRFDPQTFTGGAAALTAMVDRLQQYVPELGDPGRLMDAIPVRKAVRDATAAMFKKLDAAQSRSSMAAIRQLMSIGRQVAELGEILAG